MINYNDLTGSSLGLSSEKPCRISDTGCESIADGEPPYIEHVYKPDTGSIMTNLSGSNLTLHTDWWFYINNTQWFKQGYLRYLNLTISYCS